MSTIRDVAKLANVSTATVSRIINNDTKYKITDATRDRVLDYETDKMYWVFYVNGEYAMTGVDTTPITEGTAYLLKAEAA